MKARTYHSTIGCLLLLGNLGIVHGADNASYVNPFIGTASSGHTYPGATAPFGLVQASPDTGNIGWNYCSGYHHEDTNILGFSHTHLSGTGWMDLGDLLLLPFTGPAQQNKYASRFSHAQESASPGYYSVVLQDYGVKAEVAATTRCAFHKYTFSTNTAQLLIDLQHGIVPSQQDLENHVVKSEVKIDDSTTVSGYTITTGWAGEKHVYFHIKFNTPITGSTCLSPANATRNQRLVLTFAQKANVLLEAKLGISTVDAAGARRNLETEIPDWSFDRTRNAVHKQWNDYLSCMSIDGSKKDKENFYSALYHISVVPNNIADVDGRYRGADNQVHVSNSKAYYSTFSLWDTHRAANPLYTILWPDRAEEMVQTMLAHNDAQGYLPMWTLWGHENNCMIGNHAIPVIVDAYLKGICNSDAERAYTAIRTSSTVNHSKSDWDLYMKYGYLPSDLVKEEAVSRTLECAVDDWCVAQLAKKLGKTDDYNLFNKRSQFYRNLFDGSTGLMRGKNSNGNWITPFEQLKISHAGDAGGDYTEGNAWQYTWQVQQNPYDLIKLIGGDEAFAAKLDKLFTLESKVYGDGATVDISGLIGQYVHGNEPCHHVAYFYDYVGMPWKTQQRIREIVPKMYDNTPGGLCGNDDCGQMSAWYLFSVLGFYPVNPASGVYAIGSPSFEKVSIKLDSKRYGGKTFTVVAKGNSEKNIYIQSATLNGQPLQRSWITHKEVVSGGKLVLTMGPVPNRTWAVAQDQRPSGEVE